MVRETFIELSLIQSWWFGVPDLMASSTDHQHGWDSAARCLVFDSLRMGCGGIGRACLVIAASTGLRITRAQIAAAKMKHKAAVQNAVPWTKSYYGSQSRQMLVVHIGGLKYID